MNEIKRLPILQPLLAVAQRCIEFTLSLLQRLKLLNLFLYAASLALLSYLVMVRYSHRFDNLTLRVPILIIFILGGTILLKASGIKRTWGEFLVASLVFLAVGLKIATYSSYVNTYPFSLSWSEGNRYYYASLFFSDRIYGFSILPTIPYPSQDLMQSIPFLFPDSPLWLHRLWQVFLWIATTITTGFLLARRLSITDQLRRLTFIAWVFLFLLFGPVIYHLQVAIILILLLFHPRRFWISMVAVLLASIWAGISRINWFPVPGLLAATLYILEEPIEKRTIWPYLLWPFIWTGVGTGIAFASQATYAILAGNPLDMSTSHFTSDLLWYRLLPNPTNPSGVLPSVFFVSFPFFLIISDQMRGKWKAYHLIRLFGLALTLFALFMGGLVVSVKIGGGSNLHNLDAYLIFLLVITTYIFTGNLVTDLPSDLKSVTTRWITTVGLTLTLLLPVYFITIDSSQLDLPNSADTERALNRIKLFAQAAAEKGEEVLFIDERQMLAHNYVEDITLIPEYEKIFLMEMAMAGNEAYLSRFYEDLKNHRFALILTEPLFTKYKGSSAPFGEENDVWVKHVAEPVLCYYEPAATLRKVRLRLYKPRSNPGNCP